MQWKVEKPWSITLAVTEISKISHDAQPELQLKHCTVGDHQGWGGKGEVRLSFNSALPVVEAQHFAETMWHLFPASKYVFLMVSWAYHIKEKLNSHSILICGHIWINVNSKNNVIYLVTVPFLKIYI